ncbi:glycosyltransferase family 4 protein [soil metagenome]
MIGPNAVVGLAVLAVACAGTGMLRRYALAHDVLDIPNERSSHVHATPRGGGVAIVTAFLLGVLGFGVTGLIDASTVTSLVGAGIIVAVIGFIDDHSSLPARWRLLAHFAAAVWALAWIGGLAPVDFMVHVVDLGIVGNALAAIGLVWLLNLYNFMDGIDGIAAVEAVTAGLGAAALCWLVPAARPEGALALLLAAASAGFLLWNFPPPARIFLGDAGSGFLGLMVGTLTLHAAGVSTQLLWSWLILLGVFIVDATMTLFRRLARRERIYEAHRSHAYQHATQRIGRHGPVTLVTGAINVLFLFPVALLVARAQLDGLVGLLITYVPLAALATWLGAGSRDGRAR